MTGQETSFETQVKTESKPFNLVNWLKPQKHGIGMVAWLFQRLSGLFLSGYLLMHLLVLSTLLLGESAYDALTSILMGGIWLVFDIFLVGVLLFHSFNGIRVLLFDLGIGIKSQKQVFWFFAILGIILWIIASALIITLPPII